MYLFVFDMQVRTTIPFWVLSTMVTSQPSWSGNSVAHTWLESSPSISFLQMGLSRS
jgi:hypothetical protein